MNGESLGFLMESLFKQDGLIDAYYQSIMMKKQRPGILLTVLAQCTYQQQIADYILSHSLTLGLRYSEVERTTLNRKFEKVELDGHAVQVKLAYDKGDLIRVTPEHDDLADLARLLDRPYYQLYQQALHLIELKYGKKA